MFEPVSRSKQAGTFMLTEDERTFDKTLTPAIHGLAQWQTHDQTRTITLHDLLPNAMRHDRTRAFLRLLGRDGGTVGPTIQYLHTMPSTGRPCGIGCPRVVQLQASTTRNSRRETPGPTASMSSRRRGWHARMVESLARP